MGALTEILAENNRRYAPQYRGGLTNHLPMCVIALSRLGASDQRIREFAAEYESKLEPGTSPGPGEVAQEIRRRGRDEVLREHLANFARGLAGDAFHGVIRVAYATMIDDVDELAHALVYAAQGAQQLMPRGNGRETEVTALINRLRGFEKPTGFTITERVEKVVKDARFASIANELKVSKSTLNEVSGIGARMYLAADDFASLHVLTGAHAVRVLDRWWGDHRDDAHYALAIAAMACFIVSGSPGRAEARGQERAEWSEITMRAINSNDDHVAKCVLSCRDEEEAVGDAIYRIVATKVARRNRS